MAAVHSPRSGAGFRPPLLSAGGIVLLGLSVILVYQVAVPLGLIIWTSLKTIRPGEAGFLDFSFTLANYSRAYGIGEFWRASVNTLYFALATTVLAFIWGTFLAWTVERTNTPLGADDRPGHTRPDYYSGCDHHGLVDFDGEPEHWRFESPHQLR